MTLAKKVAYNTIIQMAGRVVVALIGLATVMILTRYLGVKGYGEYTTIVAYVSFFGIIADFGFFWILVREVSQNPKEANNLASNIFTLKIFFAFSVLVLGAIVSLFLPYEQVIKIGILLVALSSFWLSLNHILVGVFQANLRMDKPVLTEVFGRLVILGLVILAVYLKQSLIFIIFVSIIGAFFNLLLSYILVKPYIKLSFCFDFPLWRKIWKEVLPMGLVTVLGLIYFKIDIVLLSLIKGSVDVGIYGVPYKILELILAFPAIFMGNVFPALSLSLISDIKRSHFLFQRAFDFLSISAFPIIFSVIVLSPAIIKFISGPSFLEASTVSFLGHRATAVTALSILILAAGLSFLSQLLSSTLIAKGKQKLLILPSVIVVVFNIGANLLLIPKFSYLGAASTTVLSEALILSLIFYLIFKITDFRIRLKTFFKAALASFMMVFLLWKIREFGLFITLPFAFISYFFILYLLKGYTKETILSLIKREI